MRWKENLLEHLQQPTTIRMQQDRSTPHICKLKAQLDVCLYENQMRCVQMYKHTFTPD